MALLVLLLMAGLLVALVSVEWLPGSDQARDQPRHQPRDESGHESGEQSAASDPPPAGASVELPTGSRVVEGHPAGFPRTLLGAVAVPVALNRAQIGFDYDQATTVARIYAAPQDRAVVVQRAAAAVASRREGLGVPRRGAVSAPAAFALTPYAFQATGLEPGRYLVTVLSLVSSTTTTGQVATGYYAGAQVVAWSGSDWEIVEPDASDVDQLAGIPRPRPVGAHDPQRLTWAGWTRIVPWTASTSSPGTGLEVGDGGGRR